MVAAADSLVFRVEEVLVWLCVAAHAIGFDQVIVTWATTEHGNAQGVCVVDRSQRGVRREGEWGIVTTGAPDRQPLGRARQPLTTRRSTEQAQRWGVDRRSQRDARAGSDGVVLALDGREGSVQG